MDRIGVALAVVGGLTLVVALGLDINLATVLALPVALTGSVMVVDAAIHEREWASYRKSPLVLYLRHEH